MKRHLLMGLVCGTQQKKPQTPGAFGSSQINNVHGSHIVVELLSQPKCCLVTW